MSSKQGIMKAVLLLMSFPLKRVSTFAGVGFMAGMIMLSGCGGNDAKKAAKPAPLAVAPPIKQPSAPVAAATPAPSPAPQLQVQPQPDPVLATIQAAEKAYQAG